MRKIAYILTPVEYGGSEKVNLVFLKNVNRERYDVHPIILIRPWENDNTFVKALNDMGYASRVIPVAKRPVSEGRDYFRVLRCLYILHGILSEEKFDIVHTHGYFADIIGSVTSHLHNIPHIATCHGFISNDINLEIYSKLDKLSLRFCDRIIAVSDQIRKELLGDGIRESNIITIANAVENSLSEDEISALRIEKRRQLSVSEDDIIIGYVGRLSREKGIEYLIKAGAILKEKNKSFKIWIIGDGKERKELEKVSSKMMLQDFILFTGFLSDVERWFPAMDVFVLPSLTEGTPMALLEAMSHGLPVIASKVGGVPDIIKSGANGLLVRPGNAHEIADAICMLYEDENLRLKLGREARVTAQIQYGVNQWIKKIEDEYLRVVAS